MLAANSARGLPEMRQQFLDAAVQVHRQSCQHILEVGPRVMPIELGRLHQAHNHRGALASQLAAREQPCLSLMLTYA